MGKRKKGIKQRKHGKAFIAPHKAMFKGKPVTVGRTHKLRPKYVSPGPKK